MPLKDYYSILQVSTTATMGEIKQAYRKLAMQYHPDKNTGDPYAGAQFKEIKEAYETLSHPAKKDIYLQERWYQRSVHKQFDEHGALTPPNILLQCLELEKYVSTLNIFRLNRESLCNYILAILSDEHLDLLNSFDETESNRQIIRVLLTASRPLHFRYQTIIAEKLYALAGKDAAGIELIRRSQKKSSRRHYWDRYKSVLAVMLTLLLCYLIYLLGK